MRCLESYGKIQFEKKNQHFILNTAIRHLFSINSLDVISQYF